MFTKNTHCFYAIMVLSLLALLTQGCGGEEASSNVGPNENTAGTGSTAANSVESELPKVAVVEIEAGTMSRQIQLTGTVESKTEVDIQPKISETIKEVYVNEGDQVRTGQLMAMLNLEELELGVARDKARLQSTQAQLAELLAGTRAEDIDSARSSVRRAKIVYENLLRNKERYEKLHEKDILTDKDFDDLAAQLQQAKEDLDIAEANLRKSERGPRQEEIAKTRASVAAASAELALTREKLSHTEIRAPFSGVVSMRNAEVGQKADPGVALFSIYDDEALHVAVNLNERDVGFIRKGQKAEVVATSYPDRTFEGEVDILGERLDVMTRTLPVRVRLLTGTEKLLPGMFATVAIEAGRYDDAIVISRDAMRFREGRPTAFVLEDGRAKERILKLGQSTNGEVQIHSGLAVGDLLIISEIDELNDDRQIQTVETNEGVDG